MSYLRNRPFMVISYHFVLKGGQKSNTPGFMATAEWEPVENMVISDRVSTKQIQMADLIIDLFENRLVKCRESGLDNQNLINTFVTRYYGEIKEALASWIARDPANKGKVDDFVGRHQRNLIRARADVVGTELEKLARGYLFDENDAEVRKSLEEDLRVYLEGLKVHDFSVACDDQNNTQERIANNELWADVAVKFSEGDDFVHIPIRITREAATSE